MYRRTEPALAASIETDVVREHMRDMRKYQHRLAVWGGSGSNAGNDVRANVPAHYSFVSIPIHACSLRPLSALTTARLAAANTALIAESFNLFPTTKDIIRRLDDDGVGADWTRVGRDISRALDLWKSNHSDEDHEREAG